MVKHYKLILARLETLSTQIQKQVSNFDKNKGTVAPEYRAEEEKTHANLSILHKNAEAIVAVITDSEHRIYLVISRKHRHSQMC